MRTLHYFSTPFLMLIFHLSLAAKSAKKPLIASGSVTVSSPAQITHLSSPRSQGSLDRLVFGPDKTGTVFVPFSISGASIANDMCKALAVQPDGKIILAGSTKYTDGKTYYALARYLPSGHLDPTFGRINTPSAGIAYIPFIISGGTNDRANSVALQPDGKIILGGWTNKDGITYFSLARFTATGQLDPTFGKTGRATAGTTFLPLTITGGTNDQATRLVLRRDGKILLGGLSTLDRSSHFALARFTSDGQLDLSFGGQNGAPPGTNYIPFGIAGGTVDVATGLAIQSNDSIVMGGYSEDITGHNTYFSAARFTQNGILDASFGGTNGSQPGTSCIKISIADLDLTDTAIDIATDLALQANDAIVMAGFSTHGRNECSYFALARFTAEGYLDTTFGKTETSQAGTVCLCPAMTDADTLYAYATSIVLQSNGSIIVGGWSSDTNNFTTDNSHCYAALARFTAHGILDTTFGKTGTIHIPFSISRANRTDMYETPYALTLDHNQSILLGGRTSQRAYQPAYFSLARFINFSQQQFP